MDWWYYPDAQEVIHWGAYVPVWPLIKADWWSPWSGWGDVV